MYRAKFLNSEVLATTYTSPAVDCSKMELVSYHAHVVAANSPSFAISLEASSDGTDWTTVSGTSQNITASDEYMANISNVGWKYSRVKIARTDGSITVTLMFTGKETKR